MTDDEPTKSELKQRIAQLEEHVFPDRRAVLKGGAAAATAGALGFASGSAQAQASSSDSDGDIGTSTNRIDVFADGVDSNSVSTGEANVNNETFVRANRGSATSSTTTGTFVNIFDGESKDVRGEFNASAQFVPDDSGEYFVNVIVDVRGSTSVGDTLQFRIRNVTDGANISPTVRTDASSTTDTPEFTRIANLTAGKSYELQFTNADSSFKVETVSDGVICRSVVA